MAVQNVLVLLPLAFLLAMTNVTATRDLLITRPGNNLAARLETSGGLVPCWNALMELKSCSNEIVVFFLNGQTDIGPDCCSAISIITHHCWPAMLTSLGFTAEEGNILRGYCDAASIPAAAPLAGSSAPQA
ncbi:Egg cell-secreted protein 1.4 [Morella rubra]|uniref:Egg cell-secreted protein 1.4 n=1 Tax=Morella rubra TaxID=262757 RepID=A0A6A1VDT4_9ROSI|nr:Egg cell-secreted protein 1.4 [Morella rubra]